MQDDRADELRQDLDDIKGMLQRVTDKPAKQARGWASRKFIVTVVAAAAMVLADQYGVTVSPETQAAVVGLVAVWLGVEGANDWKGQHGGQ